MTALRNEVEPSDLTDHSADAPLALPIVALSALHVLCCGLLPLLLSGVSIASIFPFSPMIGGFLALLGLAGFVWYRKKRGAACSVSSERCRAWEIEPRRKVSEGLINSMGTTARRNR